jgi:hypothetical protein
MRRVIFILTMVLLTAACRRDDSVPLRGTIAIDNLLYGPGPYYAIGFTFSTAELTGNNKTPKPDLIILAETDLDGNFLGAYLSTNAFLPSFSLQGEYAGQVEAKTAFSNLASLPPSVSWTDLGRPLAENQIWLFRTSEERYAKIRIIEVNGDNRDNRAYAECKFEWVFQPDGSVTFPF